MKRERTCAFSLCCIFVFFFSFCHTCAKFHPLEFVGHVPKRYGGAKVVLPYHLFSYLLLLLLGGSF